MASSWRGIKPKKNQSTELIKNNVPNTYAGNIPIIPSQYREFLAFQRALTTCKKKSEDSDDKSKEEFLAVQKVLAREKRNTDSETPSTVVNDDEDDVVFHLQKF